MLSESYSKQNAWRNRIKFNGPNFDHNYFYTHAFRPKLQPQPLNTWFSLLRKQYTLAWNGIILKTIPPSSCSSWINSGSVLILIRVSLTRPALLLVISISLLTNTLQQELLLCHSLRTQILRIFVCRRGRPPVVFTTSSQSRNLIPCECLISLLEILSYKTVSWNLQMLLQVLHQHFLLLTLFHQLQDDVRDGRLLIYAVRKQCC